MGRVGPNQRFLTLVEVKVLPQNCDARIFLGLRNLCLPKENLPGLGQVRCTGAGQGYRVQASSNEPGSCEVSGSLCFPHRC